MLIKKVPVQKKVSVKQPLTIHGRVTGVQNINLKIVPHLYQVWYSGRSIATFT